MLSQARTPSRLRGRDGEDNKMRRDNVPGIKMTRSSCPPKVPPFVLRSIGMRIDMRWWKKMRE